MIIKVLDEIGHDEAPAFPVEEADFTKTADPWHLDVVHVRCEVGLGLRAKVAMPWDTRLLHLATLPQAGGCPSERVRDASLPVLDETPVRAVGATICRMGLRLSISWRRTGS